MLRSLRGPALLVSLLLSVSGPSTVCAQGPEEEVFVVVRTGRVLTMAGPELENVDIVLVNGKIRLVGKDLSYPKTAKIIDARREVVMPGLIHPRTRWQLPGYTRAGMHGDWSAAKEVDLSEIDFEPFLSAGFTTVCFIPEGTGVPGVGAIYRVAGPADQRELGPGYLRVTMTSPGRDKKVLRDALTKARQEIEKVEKARKEWEAKKAQSTEDKAKEEAAKKEEAKKGASAASDQDQAKEGDEPAEEKKEETPPPDKKDEKTPAAGKPEEFTPPPIDPTVMPLVEWIRDKKGLPLLYELNSASDYLHLEDVLDQAQELPCSTFYLAGSNPSDWNHVLSDLGERKPLVLLSTGVGTLPYTATRFNLAGELALAGCPIAILPRSDSRSGLQQHRVHVADLVRAGLPREEALKALTLRPAEVLGIDQRLGSIEKGKEADLIFLDGDPLAPATEVTRVMTLGQIVWESGR